LRASVANPSSESLVEREESRLKRFAARLSLASLFSFGFLDTLLRVFRVVPSILLHRFKRLFPHDFGVSFVVEVRVSNDLPSEPFRIFQIVTSDGFATRNFLRDDAAVVSPIDLADGGTAPGTVYDTANTTLRGVRKFAS
jgi:hypothetical protein